MEQETKKCPFCGELILAEAKKCKHCGEWIERDEKLMEACPYCGEDNPAGTVRCRHCDEIIKGVATDIEEDNIPETTGLFGKNLSYFKLLPAAIYLYPFIIMFSGLLYTVLLVTLNPFELYPNPFRKYLSPDSNYFYVLMLISVSVILIGLWYSRNMKIPTKTYATLRAWLAIAVANMWLPVLLVLVWLGIETEFINDPEELRDWAKYLPLAFGIGGVVTWLFLKFGKQLPLETMAKWVVRLTGEGIITILFAILFFFYKTSTLTYYF